jgi:hypothetical protein
MIPEFATELRNLNHTRVNKLVARSSLKFACEFQGRDTGRTTLRPSFQPRSAIGYHPGTPPVALAER